MSLVNEGVIKGFPEKTRFPPISASYHSTLTPAGAVPVILAVNVVVVFVQIVVVPLN